MSKKKEELYAELLLDLGYGYALWQPDPLDQYDCVNPGDVGYIQSVIPSPQSRKQTESQMFSRDGKFYPTQTAESWYGQSPPLYGSDT